MSIFIEGLTHSFSNGKGIFDLDFEVKSGEVFGYLGPNGAGKSTTIRHLLGFMKADSGKAVINGKDCWRDSAEIKKSAGYLPGEMAFIEGMNGKEFLDLLSGMRGTKDKTMRRDLISRFDFDIKTPIRKMSKGMKQKVGIVAAFMHNPDLLILDEPTSGLDPLMQQIFIELILEEKKKGKTILMSSHSFQEIDRTCDRAGIIKNGRIVAVENVHDLKNVQRQKFIVALADKISMLNLIDSSLETEQLDEERVEVIIQGDYDAFIDILTTCKITHLESRSQGLEDIFMHYYEKGEEPDEHGLI